MSEIKIKQGNVNVICEVIEVVSGNVKGPSGLVPVVITTAKGNSNWFAQIEGAGQVRAMKFSSQTELESFVSSQVKFFVVG